MATAPDWCLDCHSYFFHSMFLFSLNMLIGTAYKCNAISVTPHHMLDHFFLLQLHNFWGNKYQQLIFLILFGLAFKQPA